MAMSHSHVSSVENLGREPGVNPIGILVYESMEQLKQEIEDSCQEFELQISRPSGIVSNGTEQGRQATDEESVRVGAWIRDFSFVADARLPLPVQLGEWLRETSRKLSEAADRIESIPDSRDLQKLNELMSR